MLSNMDELDVSAGSTASLLFDGRIDIESFRFGGYDDPR